MKRMNKVSSLYIHIPFCENICDYCDFTKLQYFRLLAEPYIDSLINEIKGKVKNKKLKTIYIGGGTPTVLDDDLFLKLLSFLKQYANDVTEYTIECNPDSLTDNKLTIMKNNLVNRLSIGVESTNDKILHSINRKHTFCDVKTAIFKARSKGFDNLNVDLIIGLPNVTKQLFIKDLNNILSLDVNHISCYSLTVHEHTAFFNRGIKEPEEIFSRDLYDCAHELLNKNGYVHYEVSNWAKPEKESQHNLVYWRNQEYYGCGLGASGYEDGTRYTNTKNFNKYNSGDYLDYVEKVEEKDDIEYQIMLNLRTLEGLDLETFKNKFKFDLYLKNKNAIDDLIKDGFLMFLNDGKKLVPTYEGMMILDQIILKLI